MLKKVVEFLLIRSKSSCGGRTGHTGRVIIRTRP
jgi:hypothetical protein